jgi:hypothetical protein
MHIVYRAKIKCKNKIPLPNFRKRDFILCDYASSASAGITTGTSLGT